MQTDVGNLLSATARSYGAKNAIITDERTLTFAELDRLSTRFAAGLANLGVHPGDRVTLWLDNDWRWGVAFFGIVRCGGVGNPANCLFTVAEVRYMINERGSCGV